MSSINWMIPGKPDEPLLCAPYRGYLWWFWNGMGNLITSMAEEHVLAGIVVLNGLFRNLSGALVLTAKPCIIYKTKYNDKKSEYERRVGYVLWDTSIYNFNCSFHILSNDGDLLGVFHFENMVWGCKCLRCCSKRKNLLLWKRLLPRKS